MARVKKIMLTNAPTLKKEAKVSDAVKLMPKKEHGCVIIVEGKNPVGIITESDIIRNVVSKRASLSDNVARIMSSPVTTIHLNTKLEEASKIIDTKHYRKYPVVDDAGLVGLVTENDVVHSINDNIKFHRNLQNWILIIFVLFEFFVFVLYRYISPYLKF